MNEGAHGAYISYAVDKDPSVPTTTSDDNRDSTAHCASESSRLDIKPLLDHITTLTGENVAAQRDLTAKEKRIKELEEQLARARSRLANKRDERRVEAEPQAAIEGPPSSTELGLLHRRVKSANAAAH